jgi:hypothetical protein
MSIKAVFRHGVWSRWTLLYLLLAIPVSILAAWLLYEPLAVLGHPSVQTTGLSGRGMALHACKPIASSRVVHCGEGIEGIVICFPAGFG